MTRLNPLHIDIPPLLGRIKVECEPREERLFATMVEISAQLPSGLRISGIMPSHAPGTTSFWFQPVAAAYYTITVKAQNIQSPERQRVGHALVLAKPEPNSTLNVILSIERHPENESTLIVETRSVTSESNS